MGLPILGKIQNMYSITRDMIVDYHRSNYYGKNVTVIGVGNVNHNELTELSEKYFGVFSESCPSDKKQILNLQKPKFHSEAVFLESDVTDEINLGLFYEAPSWLDND